MTTSTDPAPRLVAGRYRLGELLGRGAMGTVWSAHDEVLGRPVAVKEVVLPPGIPDAEADVLRERSLREARAIAALSHPNVVTLYDVVREGGAPFVVMELVPSQSLAEMLRGGPVPAQRVVSIGAAVAAALQAAHAAGITHRDVKPGNVLVAHDGRIKLTDFGIARNPADQTMTTTGLMLGSPAYIAPEVASGGQVTPAADLWGLGATLFAAVEGRPPYDAGDPVMTVSAVVLDEVPMPSCSGPLAEVISGLMVKDPAARMPLATVRARLGSPPAVEPSAPSGQSGTPAAPPSPPVPAPPLTSSAPQSPAAPQSSAGLKAPAEPAEPSDAGTGSTGAAPSAAEPRTTATGQLAAEPGPLPFAVPADRANTGDASQGTTDPRSVPGRRASRSDRARRTAMRALVLWTLAATLFLAAASGGFAAARIAGGMPVVPELGAASGDGAGTGLVERVVQVSEADGSEPGTFTVAVPAGWTEFRDHGVLGDDAGSVVQFVAPDGADLITVERATGFLADQDVADYLADYRRKLTQGVSDLTQSGRRALPDGTLEATFRTREGDGARQSLRRTSYLRLVPAGSDLWVLRVSMPTEREQAARTDLFEPVAAGFTPGS
ncbi:MAG TPA: protein kinase [Pseudonocardiaceae bacterium]|nr:protein kinase [Pseudonocardiaceae bacterium]